MDGNNELTAEARIRRTALRLFAERGYGETTVRAIAGEAGVSPALVIHHYGSKTGLRAAVNDEVVQIIARFADDFLNDDNLLDEHFEAAGEGFAALLAARPDLGAYIRRLFFDGEEAGSQILDRIMEVGRRYSASLEARGFLRPAPDPEMRDLLALILDLGPVLFSPLLAAYFGGPPLDEAIYRRWVAAELDLFRHGLFAPEARSGPDLERTDE